MDGLDTLWLLTGIERLSFKEKENAYFDPIGLILLRELQCWEYWCTPRNTITFATTGGDGVHFGFLQIDNLSQNNCPIVMTLPCADISNIIVGENLREFLSIGCRGGYFSLEQIEYQPEVHIPFLESHQYETDINIEEITRVFEKNCINFFQFGIPFS